jgi:hypothetical protein
MGRIGMLRIISMDLLAVIMLILFKMIIQKLAKLLMRQLRTNSYYSIWNSKIKEKFKDKEDRLFIKLVTIHK